MTERETLDQATTVVLNAETKYLKWLIEEIDKCDTLGDRDGLVDATELLCREKERLCPKNKYDEEEYKIAVIEKRKRRKHGLS